jgi:23S rRNA pseudouridine1911/1915/1917 synthase
MLTILHEDAHCLAIDKAAGLLSQARLPGEESLELEVRRHLNPRDPTAAYVGIVHRLDRPVSGVILWAKNAKAARRLAEQFAARETAKEYLALVAPPFGTPRGVFEDWLYEGDTGLGRVQVCLAGTPRSKRAVTRFRREDTFLSPEGTGVLRLWPETGRTHQLRVQTSARGCPIVGDALYGSPHAFPCGIALHAAGLSVRHPVTDVPMTISAELPPSWLAAGVIPR